MLLVCFARIGGLDVVAIANDVPTYLSLIWERLLNVFFLFYNSDVYLSPSVKNQGCRPGQNSESCYWQLFFVLGLSEGGTDKRSQVSSRIVNNHYSASLTWWICRLLMRSHYQTVVLRVPYTGKFFYQHLYWMVIQIYKYRARYTNNLSNNISLIVVVLYQPLFRSF